MHYEENGKCDSQEENDDMNNLQERPPYDVDQDDCSENWPEESFLLPLSHDSPQPCTEVKVNDDNKVKNHFKKRKFHESLGIALVFVVLSSAQTVSLPLWEASLQDSGTDHFSGPYVILFFISCFLSITYAIISMVYWYYSGKPSTPQLTQFWKLFLGIGGCLAINGLLLVYASLPKRTPAIIQALLLNTGFLWSVPISKIFVNEKSNYQLCRCTPLSAIGMAFYGILLPLLPSLINNISNENILFSNTKGILWSLVLVVSMAPGALANVFIERFWKQRYMSNNLYDQKNHIFDLFFLNFSVNIIQFLFLALSFWVDLIPVFGFSSNLNSFRLSFHETSVCLFTPSQCPVTWILGLIFFGSFFLQTFLSAFLSVDAAAIVNIAVTLAPAVSVLFLVLVQQFWPVVDQGEANDTPLWSVAPAVLLFLFGTITWKLWERKEKEKEFLMERIIN